MRPEVFLVQTEARYPESLAPTPDGHLSRALRALWSGWGLDCDNPFKQWVAPGGRVVIKPNWVMDFHPEGHGLDALITHPALLAHVVEAAARALEGHGTILIGDAPLQRCDFAALLERSRVGEIVADMKRRYPALNLVVEDWRLTILDEDGRLGTAGQRQRPGYEDLIGDRYLLMDLGRDSFLEEIAEYSDRFRVTCYNPHLMGEHHQPGKHEYLVTRRVFEADLLINLPKMKTHTKAGLTGALKNLVGINGHKEYLPHHIQGSYFEGGDCYSKSNSFARRLESLSDHYWAWHERLSRFKRSLYRGAMRLLGMASRLTGGDGILGASWSGNETVWRMTLDLNHLLYFSPQAPRHVISIVDGIVAGEGEGPLTPSPKPLGFLIAGENPAYIDAVVAKLMGYTLARVPTVYHALNHRKSRFAGPDLRGWTVTEVADRGQAECVPFERLPNLHFVKPKHWERATARSV
ncbi:MAG TPA: DUF362 domain-containing protein [Gemmataceae bacterium]|nr:DUF362 domain-containing protein [Gemmataceae bacterium]